MRLREPKSGTGWVVRNSLALVGLTFLSWVLFGVVGAWELGPLAIVLWASFFTIIVFPSFTVPAIAVIGLLWHVRRRARLGVFMIAALPAMVIAPAVTTVVIHDNVLWVAAVHLPAQLGAAVITTLRPLPGELLHPSAAQREKVVGCGC